MPVRLTVCGLSSALSVMVRVATREPRPDGWKVNATEQLDPWGTVALAQLFAVMAKSPALVPETATVAT